MFFRKKAILMIHGFVGGCYDFNNLQNDLQLYRSFDVFTFTLPAHDKVIVKDVKYKDWLDEANQQLEFLIKNGYTEIYLIGHSMGGLLASELASKYPQVKKLVLAAPAFRCLYFKEGKIDIKSLHNTLKNLTGIIKNTEQVASRILKTPISTVLEFTKLINYCQDCVKKIKCPTLIIRGEDDLLVPSESTEYVYNSIQSKTNILVNIKGLNHDCFKSKRYIHVKNLIEEFLTKKEKKKKEIINI